jgi:hypothetical protein
MKLYLWVTVALVAGSAAGILGLYVITGVVRQTDMAAGMFSRMEAWDHTSPLARWLPVGLVAPLAVVAPLVFWAARRDSVRDRQSAARRCPAVAAVSACWLVLFTGSCFLPAYSHPGWDIYYGLGCLAGGWIAPAWWANPLALVGWARLLRGRDTGAAVISTAAAGLALTTLAWFALVQPSDVLLEGYFVWQAGFMVLAAGCWLVRWLSRPTRCN